MVFANAHCEAQRHHLSDVKRNVSFLIMRRITKKDIKGLTALQTRMAIILNKVNGVKCALEFIAATKLRNAATSVNNRMAKYQSGTIAMLNRCTQ